MGGRPGGMMGGPPGFGRGGFGPGTLLAPILLRRADVGGDQKVDRTEFLGLADRWFEEAGVETKGTLDRDQFVAALTAWLDDSQDLAGDSDQPALGTASTA